MKATRPGDGRCAAFAQSGERCKNAAGEESRYCRLHQEPFGRIEGFFVENREHMIGFMLGVITETIVDDLYGNLPPLFGQARKTIETESSSDQLFKTLGGMLNCVILRDRRYRIEYIRVRREEPGLAVYECIYPTEYGDRSAGGNGDIYIYYVDERSRRYVGALCGPGVRPDHTTVPTGLICHYHMGAIGGSDSFYRLGGPEGHEYLAFDHEDDGAEIRRAGRGTRMDGPDPLALPRR